MKSNNRRIFLINKKFQIKFFIWFFIGMSILNLILYASNLYLFNSFKMMGSNVGLDTGHPYFVFVKEQKDRMNAIFLSAYIIETVILLIFSYIFSHRIAGPIHRMKLWLDRISQGEDVADLSFRKNDFFAELPDLANKAVLNLKSRKK